jgi:hypothetical protein
LNQSHRGEVAALVAEPLPGALAALVEMSSDPDSARSGRVMEAILTMKKINLDELQRAYAG